MAAVRMRVAFLLFLLPWLAWGQVNNLGPGSLTGSGTTTASVGANGTVCFAFFGALLTAISGTGATATLTMSC